MVAALILLIVSTAFAPRFMGIGPGLVGLGFLSALAIRKQGKIVCPRNALIWSLVFISLSLVSVLWSLDVPFALERTGKITAILLSGVALLSVSMTLKRTVMPVFYKFFPYAVMFLAGFLLCELAFDLPFHRAIKKVPEYRSEMSYILNRSTVCLALFMLPALFLVWKKMRRRPPFRFCTCCDGKLENFCHIITVPSGHDSHLQSIGATGIIGGIGLCVRFSL